MTDRLPAGCCALITALVLPNVSIAGEVGADGRWRLDAPADGGELVLEETGRNITAAYLAGDPQRAPLVVAFNQDASEVKLLVPDAADGAGTRKGVVLELAEASAQFPDGRIVFSALDATVDGDGAKLESHPGNHRIGFWTELADSVHWTYQATRPGMYDVELCYSLAASGISKVEVAVGDSKAEAELSPTGSWYRYSSAPAGRVYIERAGELAVRMRGSSKAGTALMNLKAITLRPAPEGDPVVQGDDGIVELDASAATVHSTLMQYERNPKKRCLGYWANPKDWASWHFPIAKPGKFKVELTQGCGAGHGGSEVAVSVGGENLHFVVDDTGGFQNWKVRELGEITLREAGDHQLEIRPQNKSGVAVMDVRRVRLIPIPID